MYRTAAMERPIDAPNMNGRMVMSSIKRTQPNRAGVSRPRCVRGQSPHATNTEQPRGARRSHQNAKTNGTRGRATREAQTPGHPEGASAKTEGRGANARPKPTRNEAKKTASTTARAKRTQPNKAVDRRLRLVHTGHVACAYSSSVKPDRGSAEGNKMRKRTLKSVIS